MFLETKKVWCIFEVDQCSVVHFQVGQNSVVQYFHFSKVTKIVLCILDVTEIVMCIFSISRILQKYCTVALWSEEPHVRNKSQFEPRFLRSLVSACDQKAIVQYFDKFLLVAKMHNTRLSLRSFSWKLLLRDKKSYIFYQVHKQLYQDGPHFTHFWAKMCTCKQHKRGVQGVSHCKRKYVTVFYVKIDQLRTVQVRL